MKRRSLMLVACVGLAGCGLEGVTDPGPVPTPVAEPTPLPVVVAPVLPAGGLEVSWSDGACFKVENRTGVTVALASFWTGFDDQTTPHGTRAASVPPGESWGHCYALACVQVDVDQPGVKPLGGFWFDKDQRAFDAHREPAKVEACRRAPVPVPTPQPSPTPSCGNATYPDGTPTPNCGRQ